jgi:hypothetical protein
MACGWFLVIVATLNLYLWLAPRCGWLLAAMRATELGLWEMPGSGRDTGWSEVKWVFTAGG